jgi:surfeit locus 1 family protein
VVFLTPIVPDDGGPAVLLNRGWAYSADGMRVDSPLWREGARDSVVGWAEVFTSGPGPVSIAGAPRGIRRLAWDSLQALVPYPLARLVAVQQRGAGEQEKVAHPFRAELPPLDEGPHRSYAIQWFAFALIVLVGGAAVARSQSAGAARSRGRAPP